MNEPKEIIQEKLYKSILKLGRTHKKTVKLSEKLDKIIVFEQKAIMGISKLVY